MSSPDEVPVDAKANYGIMEIQIHELRRENDELRGAQRIAKVEEQLLFLKNKIRAQKYDEEIQQLRQELDAAVQHRTSTTEAELLRMKDDHHDDGLQQSLLKAENQIQEYEQELEEKDKRIKQLHSQLTKLEKKNASLHEKNESNEWELNSLSSMVENLQNKNETLDYLYTNLKKVHGDTATESKTKSMEPSFNRDERKIPKFVNPSEEVKTLIDMYKKLQSEKVALIKANDVLESENDRITNELDEERTEREELENDWGHLTPDEVDAKANYGIMEIQLGALRRENEHLMTVFRTSKAEIASNDSNNKKIATKHAEEIHQLQLEVTKYRQERDVALQRIAKLEVELPKELNAKVEYHCNMEKELRLENNQLKDTYRALLDEISSSRDHNKRKLANLTESVKQKEKEVKQYRQERDTALQQFETEIKPIQAELLRIQSILDAYKQY